MNVVPVILAGGMGKRLWPLSQKGCPKPFLNLVGKHSLFEQTLLRIKGLSKVEELIVVAHESHYFACRDQMRDFPFKRVTFILEPCSRSTAPALALAAHSMAKNCVMLALPTDHLIESPKRFAHLIKNSLETAKREALVIFGVKPRSAVTSYGYIKKGAALDDFSFRVDQFIEKPNKESAKAFFSTGNYFWNSGIFLMRKEQYLEELKKEEPTIYKSCERAVALSEKRLDYIRVDRESFEECPEISVDSAVMERTDCAAVIPLRLSWSDLGCWTSIADAKRSNHQGSFVQGSVIAHKCTRCFLRSDEGVVVTIGIKDQIVVSTKDGVLVADKNYAEKIKEILNPSEESRS